VVLHREVEVSGHAWLEKCLECEQIPVVAVMTFVGIGFAVGITPANQSENGWLQRPTADGQAVAPRTVTGRIRLDDAVLLQFLEARGEQVAAHALEGFLQLIEAARGDQ